jgi:hypothetical protein
MLQNRLATLPGLDVRPPLNGKTPDRRAHAFVAGTVLGGAWDESRRWADADTPVFALLCFQFGLPVEDARRWPTSGRRVAFVLGDVPAPVVVPNPTVDLLERTLAALHAWEPAARA